MLTQLEALLISFIKSILCFFNILRISQKYLFNAFMDKAAASRDIHIKNTPTNHLSLSMSTEITTDPIKHCEKSENNNYLDNLKELNTFNSGGFSMSNDSDYIDSSRSDSINSDKSTEQNDKNPEFDHKETSVSKSDYNTDITAQYSCSPSIRNDEGSITEILDSGISSPTCNCSDHLDSNKRDKSISSKEKFIENNSAESPVNDISGSKVPNSKFQFRLPKLLFGHHNSTNIGGIVNRIRSLSISMAYNSNNSSRRTSGDGSSLPSESISPTGTTPDIDSDPTKLPKEYLTSSINFTSKNLRSSRKWLRMSHSLSCDAEPYNVPEFAATQNRLEKYLSGHLDASTPSGALLKVINQGLRKVSESDHYLLFSKSPLRCPIDFLESGIEHLGDTEMLITVFHHSTCYDLMPDSGKLIVLDSRIQINKAFMALDDHTIDSAPIWCNTNRCFCGILTKEDQIHFLSFLHQLKKTDVSFEEQFENLSKETIENCIAKDPLRHELQLVSPENTVASAIKKLKNSTSNKVLVLDVQRSGNALFILDHGLILSFLFNASKAGLPLPGVLKTSVGVTELMSSRKSLDKYYVFLDTDVGTLLQVMNENPHHCALVCVEISSANSCSCRYNCVAVITVDYITHLISTSKICYPSYTVQSILNLSSEVNPKLIRCTERDSIIDIVKRFSVEKASLALISLDCSKKCIHSVISTKELLDYIMKHDHIQSSSRESVFAVDKSKCFRSVSCCEDSPKLADINLSEVSLDEKDEDVFNMEMT